MKSIQSFTESMACGTTCHFKKFLVPVDQNFIICSNLVRVVLCIIHSNAEEELVFLPFKKSVTPQGASLELDGILPSIVSFHLNWPVGEKCYQYKPSEKIAGLGMTYGQ